MCRGRTRRPRRVTAYDAHSVPSDVAIRGLQLDLITTGDEDRIEAAFSEVERLVELLHP